MPHEVIGELVGAAVEGALAVADAGGSNAADKVHRRYGWRGCFISLAIIAAIIGLIIWAVS